MDHLSSTEPDPRFCVPFIAEGHFAYDQKGFIDFPKRQGIIGNDFSGGIDHLEPEHVRVLLQSWLFFGLLSEFMPEPGTIDVDSFVITYEGFITDYATKPSSSIMPFGASKTRITQGAFLHSAWHDLDDRRPPSVSKHVDNWGKPLTGRERISRLSYKTNSRWDSVSRERSFDVHRTFRRRLTTKRLMPLLSYWRRKMTAHPDRSRLMRLLMMLNTHREVLQFVWMYGVGIHTATVLSAVRETLEWAVEGVLTTSCMSITGWSINFKGSWNELHDEMAILLMEQGWCPHHIWHLSGILGNNLCGLYYASTLGFPPGWHIGQRDHSDCTVDYCRGIYVSQDVYNLRHVQVDCCCPMVRAPPASVEAAVNQVGVALLEYSEVNNYFKVIPGEPGLPYVVVSHVWADGLGNPMENAMVACQIRRLADLTKKFADFQGRNVLFWIDSICVPHSRELRNKAIRKMYDVYSEAYATLVFSAELMNFTAGNDEYVEPAMRIATCGWMRRLWTFQEGAMSRRLYFLFCDGLKDVEDLELLYHRTATHSVVAGPARSFYSNLLRPRVSIDRRTDANLVAEIYRAIQWRTTFHTSDEVLAIARILNVDEVKVLETERDTRMEVLLKSLPEIPPGMIFLPGRRLQTQSFRWAPATWMIGVGLDVPDPLILEDPTPMPHKYSVVSTYSVLTERGLLVRFPGFRLHKSVDMTVEEFWDYADNVSFPTDSRQLTWWSYTRQATDHDHATQIKLTGDDFQKANFGIICYGNEWPYRKQLALLVLIIGEDEGTFHVRWLARIELQTFHAGQLPITEQLERRQEKPLPFLGEILPSNQLWTVD